MMITGSRPDRFRLVPRRARRRGRRRDRRGVLRADDVSLIPGTTVKQAIGGRVRGTVQSESPTEVVVTLGTDPVSVPTDQIASIRYDGQSANFQLGETREATGQLAEAAELFRKAACRGGRPAVPHQAALFREASVLGDLAMIEPDRTKEARDKLNQFIRLYPGAATSPPRARRWPGCRSTPAISPAPRPPSPLSPRCPRGGERSAVLRTKLLASKGSTRRRSPRWIA